MPVFKVVLVEPKYGGNIGAVARVMKNFGVTDLVTVSPQVMVSDEECRQRAVHAQEILDQARVVDSFHKGITGSDFVVGTSSISSSSDRRHLRKALSLRDFGQRVYDIEGTVSLVFGREDYGLFNREIEECDVLVKIPVTEEYPSLNLSHAVGVVLYDLFQMRRVAQKVRRVGKVEKDVLYHYVSLLLDSIQYPEHKREKTVVMLKRILGRAMVSQYEYHTLMGVIRGAVEAIDRQ